MEQLYKLKKPEKYLGDPSRIFYRSSWEKAFLYFLEESPVIKKFNSEEIVILYFYLLDKKWHRYFVDFYVELITGFKYLIEIKPFHERLNPVDTTKNKNKINQHSIQTFIKNQSKWEAAKQFAEQNGMEFIILDEYDLRRMGIKIPINYNKRKLNQKILFEQLDKYKGSVEKLSRSLKN